MRNHNLDVYLANLGVLNAKLHNLHWNIVGPSFQPVHEMLEKLYDDCFEKYDEVAEYMKMHGGFPQASYKEYLEITTVKELPSKAISIPDAVRVALDDVKALRDLATTIRNEAEDGQFTLANMMEDHVAGYVKVIWFLESALRGA